MCMIVVSFVGVKFVGLFVGSNLFILIFVFMSVLGMMFICVVIVLRVWYRASNVVVVFFLDVFNFLFVVYVVIMD